MFQHLLNGEVGKKYQKEIKKIHLKKSKRRLQTIKLNSINKLELKVAELKVVVKQSMFSLLSIYNDTSMFVLDDVMLATCKKQVPRDLPVSSKQQPKTAARSTVHKFIIRRYNACSCRPC